MALGAGAREDALGVDLGSAMAGARVHAIAAVVYDVCQAVVGVSASTQGEAWGGGPWGEGVPGGRRRSRDP